MYRLSSDGLSAVESQLNLKEQPTATRLKVRKREMCAGISGNVLINEKTTRLLSYNVWNYAEGYDSFYRSMLVDLTQPPGRVSQLCLSITIIHDTVRWLLFFFLLFPVCQKINSVWMKFQGPWDWKSNKFEELRCTLIPFE